MFKEIINLYLIFIKSRYLFDMVWFKYVLLRDYMYLIKCDVGMVNVFCF